MKNSKTSATPIVAHNGTNITNVGVTFSHNTNTTNTYAGTTLGVGRGGSSTLFAGGSRDISSSSTIGAGAYVDTRKNYSASISFEKKF
jgi:hypothetical protein